MKAVKLVAISVCEKLPTALLTERAAPLFQIFDKKFVLRAFGRRKVRLAPRVISGGCLVREVEVSELLRLYLRSAIGQPKQQHPSPGAWEKGRGSPERSTKSSTKLQKQTQEMSSGVFQTLERLLSNIVNTLAVGRFFPSFPSRLMDSR